MPYDAIFSNKSRNRHFNVSSIQLNSKLQVELVNLKVSWMRDFCQIAKHVLRNILKTNHENNVKLTEHFIHTIIKLLVENSMSRLKFFKLYLASDSE